ncbi:unnamed protein product, partial [Symbiodinium sp. CCMP2456]
ASVTPEFLAEPYARLRKKKLDFVTSALRNACATGKYSLAFALYHRGLALKAFEERNGGEWRSGAIQAEIKRLRADVSTIHGEFVIETSGGAFGTSTWRKNPCYLIRHSKSDYRDGLERAASKKIDKKPGSKSSAAGVRVSVALAEASDSPATMAVHVVRNNKEVHEAGAGYMLMPGYDVLASSHEDDDIPSCEFDLPPSSQPLFIVPSAAKGELGPFTLIVNATESVDVIRIPPANCEPQRFQERFEVKWLQERPYQVCMGGGRFRNRAPMVSWYRNPQFRVKLKQSEEPPPAEPRTTLALPAPDPNRSKTPPPPRLSRPESLGPLVPAPRPNTAPTTPASAEKMDLKKLRMIFDSADVQGNGMVNKRELVKGLRRDAKMAEFFGLPSEIRQEDGSRDQMEALFQAMDSDSDREITWEEFVAFQASLHLRKSQWSEDASEVNASKSEVDFSTIDATPPPLLGGSPSAVEFGGGSQILTQPIARSGDVMKTLNEEPQSKRERVHPRFTRCSANADRKQFGMAFDFWLLQAGPAAVHILRNLEGMGKVLAQSGLRHTGREYSSASE